MEKLTDESKDRMQIEDELPEQRQLQIERNIAESHNNFLSFPQEAICASDFNFHISESFYEEHKTIRDAMCSKRNTSKDILCKKRDSNKLFVDSSNHKGCMYQTFIPNKVKF